MLVVLELTVTSGTTDKLARVGETPMDSKVAILYAFVNNLDDARNSPSVPYRDKLLNAGCMVDFHDPYVFEFLVVDSSHERSNVGMNADLVTILTGHDEYFRLDAGVLKGLMGEERPVVDADGFIGAGFLHNGIGRGDRNECMIL